MPATDATSPSAPVRTREDRDAEEPALAADESDAQPAEPALEAEGSPADTSGSSLDTGGSSLDAGGSVPDTDGSAREVEGSASAAERPAPATEKSAVQARGSATEKSAVEARGSGPEAVGAGREPEGSAPEAGRPAPEAERSAPDAERPAREADEPARASEQAGSAKSAGSARSAERDVEPTGADEPSGNGESPDQNPHQAQQTQETQHTHLAQQTHQTEHTHDAHQAQQPAGVGAVPVDGSVGGGVAADPADEVASGLDALEAPTPSTAKTAYRRVLAKAGPPLIALAAVLFLWQLAYALNWSATLPSPASVGDELATAWSDGTLLPALAQSLLRCLVGFAASAAVGVPLGLLLTRVAALRTVLGPILSSLQSLPAAALVPVAVIALGNSEGAVYAVVLLGAVPSIAVGVASAVDQVPPLLLRAGRSMGASGLRGAAHVLVPAALPGFVAALRQGWTFGWRALMTAELITATPLPGIGRMLDAGKQSGELSLVLAAVVLILAVGVLVESAVFAPVERRVLHGRGLATARV
ncbi:ABC transporter permease subunit [Streptomyces sp. NPDC002851]